MSPLKIYTALNAILFIVFGVWCLLDPEYTAAAIGLAMVGDQGFAEYLAVYGGLQMGLGVFYGLATAHESVQRPAILLSISVYSGLVLARMVAVMNKGPALGFGWYYFALEGMLLSAALFLHFRR